MLSNALTISLQPLICLKKKEKQNFKPIDIVYKPVKSINKNTEYFFIDEIRLAYRSHYQEGKSSKSL